MAAAHALVVAGLLLRLYAQRNVLHPITTVIYVATLVLVIESLLHALARRLPAETPPQCRLDLRPQRVLPALFGESGPLRSLAATAEKSFGVRLADTWLVQLGRLLFAPLVLLGIVGVLAFHRPHAVFRLTAAACSCATAISPPARWRRACIFTSPGRGVA
jgi:hypothetical protein